MRDLPLRKLPRGSDSSLATTESGRRQLTGLRGQGAFGVYDIVPADTFWLEGVTETIFQQ